MKFDMGSAWNEAVALAGANKELLAIIAGLFVFLPNLALALFVPEFLTGPATPPGNPDPDQAMDAMMGYYARVGPAIGILTFINAIGSLAMIALLTAGRPTVGEALKTGAITLLPYVAAQIILVLGLSLVIGVPLGLAVALGGAAGGVIVGLLAIAVFFYLFVKFSLLSPTMIIGGTLNPFTALLGSWRATKGNSFRLAGFYLLLGVGVMVVGIVITIVSGLFVAMLGTGTAGLLIGGAVNGVFAAAIGIVSACILTAVYRQLSGPNNEATAELFD